MKTKLNALRKLKGNHKVRKRSVVQVQLSLFCNQVINNKNLEESTLKVLLRTCSTLNKLKSEITNIDSTKKEAKERQLQTLHILKGKTIAFNQKNEHYIS